LTGAAHTRRIAHEVSVGQRRNRSGREFLLQRIIMSGFRLGAGA